MQQGRKGRSKEGKREKRKDMKWVGGKKAGKKARDEQGWY